MRRTLLVLAVSGALLPVLPLHAQPIPMETRPATFAGLHFLVPAGFTPVPALSDDRTAVFASSSGSAWAFVSPLPSASLRPELIRTLTRRLAIGALGGAEGLEWQMVPSFPTDSAEGYHLEMAVWRDERRSLQVSFRQLRAGGHDVMVGSAFAYDPSPGQMMCGETASVVSAEAEGAIAAALLGRPQPGHVVLTMGTRTAPEPPPNPEARRVLDAFDAYARAIRGRDTAAASMVTPALLAFYDDLRTLALHATAEQVRELPLLARMHVLHLRLKLDAARLRAMTPAQVFSTIEVESGNLKASLVPGEVAVNPATASFALMDGDRRTSYQVALVRQGGAWRVDTLPLSASGGCILRAVLRARGVTREREDAVVLNGLAQTTGRVPSSSIWQPLDPAGSRP